MVHYLFSCYEWVTSTPANLPLMKRLLSLLLLLPLSLTAQDYWNYDYFTADSVNWSTTPDENGDATLVVENGVLNLNLAATTASGEVYRTWGPDQGSSIEDWSVYFDFDFSSLSLSSGQELTWFLNAASSLGDGANNVTVGATLLSGASNAYGGAAWANSSTKGSFGDTVSFSGFSGTIGFAFDWENKLIIAGYDEDGATDGYNFSSIGSYDVTSWGLGESDVFYASLGLSYSTDSTGFDAISSGFVTADNFTVTDINVSAVPEPSTYAAFFGLTALGAALWSRRRRAIA